MYKESKYNFFSNLDFNNEVACYNALYDSLFIISSEEYLVIQELFIDLIKFKQQDVDLFNKMVQLGFIFKEENKEIDIIRYYNKKQTFLDETNWITINPTLNCNASCWYCSTELSNVEHNKSLMSSDTVNSVINRISNLLESGNSKIHLDWFGGEPLLGFNKVMNPIINSVINHKKYNSSLFSQHITTNASLLSKDKIVYLTQANLKSFQITLDGNEEKHNCVKKIEGINSFNQVVKCINNIFEIEKNASVVLRINYDEQTLEQIDQIIQHIPKTKNITIDFQKIWQVSLNDNIKKNILTSMRNIHNSGYKVNFWAFRPGKFYTCYVDRYRHEVINYTGEVFKCTARDYSSKMRTGNINTNGTIDFNEQLLSKYFSKATFENDNCLNCKTLPLCFGPCTQKIIEFDEKKTEFPCLMKNSEIEVDEYIKFKAQIHKELLSTCS